MACKEIRPLLRSTHGRAAPGGSFGRCNARCRSANRLRCQPRRARPAPVVNLSWAELRHLRCLVGVEPRGIQRAVDLRLQDVRGVGVIANDRPELTWEPRPRIARLLHEL